MDDLRIRILPVQPEHFDTYIRVGSRSYKQHYLHLWQRQDPSYYIDNSFRKEVIRKEWEDPNCRLFLIYANHFPAGIVKLILKRAIPKAKVADCLFLERIYFLREYSGQGLGRLTLQYIEKLGRNLGKTLLCLATMQKGRALDFYKQNGFAIIAEKQLDFPGLVDSERPMFILGKNLG